MRISKLYIKSFIAGVAFSSFLGTVQGQIAKDKCKYLGNVIANSVPTTFNTYWNQVTPENSGKWGSVEAIRNTMNWNALDLAYSHAKSNGFPFKQHTFVWGQQQPGWLTTLMNNTSIPIEERYEQVRNEVEEWIRLYCERYPDTDQIDVVNEPFHATPLYDLALGTGWNWVKWAFQKARIYCPKAQLILNDYNIINVDAATNDYLALINLLKADNLIDGIGIQCHRFEIENVPVTRLKSNLDKLATSGLPIYISEFDVGNLNNTSTGSSTTDDAVQLEIMQRVFPVLWQHPAVQGITIWGYLQGVTWQETAYLLRTDGTERPALMWLKNYVPTQPGGSFCLTTSTNEVEDSFTVYPNPAPQGKFAMQLPAGFYSIVIRDLSGRVIKQFKVSNQQVVPIQIEEPPGQYLVEIRNNQRTTFTKIIVN
ncbi:MAG: endo-1,4-beta-xylanase [Cyclobacteriaceae bacterium]|nr:endo-1,4-beta-xylanase [Cyclobacteriaceae bacterium]